MYDYYEYIDQETNSTLAFKFLKSEPKVLQQKHAFLKLLKKAAAELEADLTKNA